MTTGAVLPGARRLDGLPLPNGGAGLLSQAAAAGLAPVLQAGMHTAGPRPLFGLPGQQLGGPAFGGAAAQPLGLRPPGPQPGGPATMFMHPQHGAPQSALAAQLTDLLLRVQHQQAQQAQQPQQQAPVSLLHPLVAPPAVGSSMQSPAARLPDVLRGLPQAKGATAAHAAGSALQPPAASLLLLPRPPAAQPAQCAAAPQVQQQPGGPAALAALQGVLAKAPPDSLAQLLRSLQSSFASSGHTQQAQQAASMLSHFASAQLPAGVSAPAPQHQSQQHPSQIAQPTAEQPAARPATATAGQAAAAPQGVTAGQQPAAGAPAAPQHPAPAVEQLAGEQVAPPVSLHPAIKEQLALLSPTGLESVEEVGWRRASQPARVPASLCACLRACSVSACDASQRSAPACRPRHSARCC